MGSGACLDVVGKKSLFPAGFRITARQIHTYIYIYTHTYIN